MSLTTEQNEQLLKGINANRVASRRGGGGKSLSYLEAWDVKAHMNRIFGFGNWSWDVLAADLAYAFGPEDGNKNHRVGYRVIGRLTIHSTSATYTEAAVGMANLPDPGEAHDMAIKTGESDAFKRAAINLGDQFGLSLYNNGSTSPVVRGIVGHTKGEIVPEPVVSASNEADAADDTPGADIIVEALREAMAEGDVAKVVEIKQQATRDNALEWVHGGKTIGKMIDLAVIHAGKVAAGREALGGEEVAADA